MNLEDRLARFRPASPPPELRARVLGGLSSRRRGPRLDWLLPIAAAVAVAVFSGLASRERQRAAIDPSGDDRVRGPLVDLLTDEMNGDTVLAAHVVAVEFVEDARVE